MKTIVIGAGIIGASIAYGLSQRGAEVIVVEDGAPAASDTSFGWINASFYHDAAHHALRVASMDAYRTLKAQSPDLPIQTCGALWWEEQGAGLARMQAELEAKSYPVERLSAQEAKTCEPALAFDADNMLRFPSESAADVRGVAEALLKASAARVVRGVQVKALSGTPEITGVETDIGHMEADRVVVAAGTGSPAILSTVGVQLPMLTRPGALVTSKPIAAKIKHILVTPHGEVRQLPDGRLLASAVANHQGDDSDHIAENPQDIAERVLGWLDPMIRNETLDWDSVSLANRPVPQDGLPVIGQIGPIGLHVAVMHSGVTLAALAGQATADEVLGGTAYQALLAPYRPERFQ